MISMIENHLVWILFWWRTKYPDQFLKGYNVDLQHALGVRIPNRFLNFLFRFTFGRKVCSAFYLVLSLENCVVVGSRFSWVNYALLLQWIGLFLIILGHYVCVCVCFVDDCLIFSGSRVSKKLKHKASVYTNQKKSKNLASETLKCCRTSWLTNHSFSEMSQQRYELIWKTKTIYRMCEVIVSRLFTVGRRVICRPVSIAFHFKRCLATIKRLYDRIMPEYNWSCVTD